MSASAPLLLMLWLASAAMSAEQRPADPFARPQAGTSLAQSESEPEPDGPLRNASEELGSEPESGATRERRPRRPREHSRSRGRLTPPTSWRVYRSDGSVTDAAAPPSTESGIWRVEGQRQGVDKSVLFVGGPKGTHYDQVWITDRWEWNGSAWMSIREMEEARPEAASRRLGALTPEHLAVARILARLTIELELARLDEEARAPGGQVRANRGRLKSPVERMEKLRRHLAGNLDEHGRPVGPPKSLYSVRRVRPAIDELEDALSGNSTGRGRIPRLTRRAPDLTRKALAELVALTRAQ